MQSASNWTAHCIAVVALILPGIGCVDTRGSLDEFNQRYARTHDAGDNEPDDAGPCALPAPDELSGRFALVVSPAFSPLTPIVFRADLTAQADGDRLAVGWDLVALNAQDRTTPVGAPLPRRDFNLGAGAFSADFGVMEIAGEADPIIFGALIRGQLTLSGRLCSARDSDAAATIDFLCGNASGTLTDPTALDLTGSTWAALRVTDSAPAPALVIDCAGNPPQPL